MANTEGIAKASHHLNVSQTSLYKWKQKLESLGESALENCGGDQQGAEGPETALQQLLLEAGQRLLGKGRICSTHTLTVDGS